MNKKVKLITLIVFLVLGVFTFKSLFNSNKLNTASLVPYLKKNGKYIFVDSSSMNKINSLEFDFCRRHHGGFAAIKINKKWGFVDANGVIVIKPNYEDCSDFSDGLAAVKFDNKWGFIDIANKLVIPNIYDWASSFENGLAEVSTMNSKSNNSESNYGFINRKGIQIISCIYSTIYCKNEGYYGIGYIYDEGNYSLGFCNSLGKVISSPKFDDIRPFNEGLAAVAFGTRFGYKGLQWGTANWGFIDTTGKIKIPMKYPSAASFHEGMAVVQMNDRFGYINKSGQLILPNIYDGAFDFSENVAAVVKNIGGIDRLGFIDRFGNVVIGFHYYPFGNSCQFKDGFAAVAIKEDQFEVINKKGDIITHRSYGHIENFESGHAIVGIGEEQYGSDGYAGFEGKCGLINYDGKEVVPIKYVSMSFERGLYMVSLNEKNYYIDCTGREYLEK